MQDRTEFDRNVVKDVEKLYPKLESYDKSNQTNGYTNIAVAYNKERIIVLIIYALTIAVRFIMIRCQTENAAKITQNIEKRAFLAVMKKLVYQI